MARRELVRRSASSLRCLTELSWPLAEQGSRLSAATAPSLEPCSSVARSPLSSFCARAPSPPSPFALERHALAQSLKVKLPAPGSQSLPDTWTFSSHVSTASILRGSASFSGGVTDSFRGSSSGGGGQGQGHWCGQQLRTLAYISAATAAVAAASAPAASAKQIPLKPIPEDVVLYQYEACPFCNKVKAYLDYNSIPYKVVEVNPLTRKEIKWSEYKKVPILVIDGESLVDSSAIISTLQEKLNPSSKKATKKEEESTEEETKWRNWVDKHLVHLLSPNIYRTPSEALEAFEYIATNGNFGTLERAMARYVGASTMYFIGKKLKKKHNIDDERQSLYSALDEWVDAVGSRKFLGGEKPNLADLAVFGVLRPIRHMQTGRDMIEKTRIGQWYTSMESEVGSSGRLPEEKK